MTSPLDSYSSEMLPRSPPNSNSRGKKAMPKKPNSKIPNNDLPMNANHGVLNGGR
jgi:hypothetical protein